MTTQTISSAGTEIALDIEDTGGDGRPVVLIHGWPLSLSAWSDQVSALAAAGHRVVSYTRRGFGHSDKPADGYEYDTLSDDLQGVLEALNLRDVSLVGFSMGGGEVARYVSRHGQDRIHSVVFAAAIPPYLMQTADNPDGPLTEDAAGQMRSGLEDDRDGFFPGFVRTFFSAGDDLLVSEQQVDDAVQLCQLSDQTAALGCMDAFGTTDFRDDLTSLTVPALVIHGDADGIVPLEGSGARTHESLADSELHVIAGGPHGINTSHAEEFNQVLVDFLRR